MFEKHNLCCTSQFSSTNSNANWQMANLLRNIYRWGSWTAAVRMFSPHGMWPVLVLWNQEFFTWMRVIHTFDRVYQCHRYQISIDATFFFKCRQLMFLYPSFRFCVSDTLTVSVTNCHPLFAYLIISFILQFAPYATVDYISLNETFHAFLWMHNQWRTIMHHQCVPWAAASSPLFDKYLFSVLMNVSIVWVSPPVCSTLTFNLPSSKLCMCVFSTLISSALSLIKQTLSSVWGVLPSPGPCCSPSNLLDFFNI